MNSMQKEIVIHRLLSGKTKIDIKGQCYIVALPLSFDYYMGQEIYQDTYHAALSEGILSAEDIVGFLLLQKLWDANEESRLDDLKAEIDKLKIRVYQAGVHTNQSLIARKLLKNCREEYKTLFYRRHQYDYATSEGLAGLARSHYLVGSTLCDRRGEKIWKNGEFWEDGDDGLIDQIMIRLRDQQPDELVLRDIARTEPWRTYWISSNKQPFSGAAGDLSEEQRSLIMWSKMYDSIYEHPERPSDDVIQDNDMLDGWLLLEQQERKEKQQQQVAERQITENKRIAGSQHVFLMTNEIYTEHGRDAHLKSLEEVKAITDSLNTPAAKMIKQERFAVIKAAGEIEGAHLPDVQRDLRMQANQRLMKGN
jgi:hypothetical protein